MALQDPQAEPSMEEILASIRRIISEEEQPVSEPVLDLTQQEPAAAGDDDIVFEAVEQAAAAEQAPAPAPAPQAAPKPARAPAIEASAPSADPTYSTSLAVTGFEPLSANLIFQPAAVFGVSADA